MNKNANLIFPFLSTAMISRPKTIDDVSSQDNTVAVLRKALASTNVSSTPNHHIICISSDREASKLHEDERKN